MGLPSFGPYKSVDILQHKDKFRAFLKENNFTVPWAYGFSSVEDALNSANKYTYPLIVKPTDSAGSKGCSRVDSFDQLKTALEYAIQHSPSKHLIVEEFITQHGCSSDTDCFSIDGKFAFVSFSAQRFDKNAANPYTPSAYSWPSTYTKAQEEELHSELQRLITLLGMKTTVYNIETRIGTNGKPYIMEVSPRGGGNRLCEMLRYATGVDLITATVRAAVGDSVEGVEQKTYKGHWAEVILHADKDGIFDKLWIDERVRKHVIEEDLWVKQGEKVEAFNGANNAIGTLVMNFESASEMESFIEHPSQTIKILVK